MLTLDYAEFYITNVCNLSCDWCNRLNNFKFKGHQKWADYKDDYKKWADIVDIKYITILGGEPTLNPDFIDWVVGINGLWPNADIEINTNGTQLHKWPELYDIVKLNKNIQVRISLHGGTTEQAVKKSLRKYYTTPLKPLSKFEWKNKWESIRGKDWPDCDTIEDFDKLPSDIKIECIEVFKINPIEWSESYFKGWLVDDNGVKIQILDSVDFYQPAIKIDSVKKQLTLHNSDPTKAVANCPYARDKVIHFIKGKLYKCHLVGALPEFIEQFNVTISDEDLKLLKSYQPAEHSHSEDRLNQFMYEINNRAAIPQCKLCPEKYTLKKNFSSFKKIPIFPA